MMNITLVDDEANVAYYLGEVHLYANFFLKTEFAAIVDVDNSEINTRLISILKQCLSVRIKYEILEGNQFTIQLNIINGEIVQFYGEVYILQNDERIALSKVMRPDSWYVLTIT